MKWSSSIGKILVFLIPVLLTEQTHAQRPIRFPGYDNNEQNCPSGTRCMAINRCRPSIISTMTEEPRACGYTYNWRRRVCCPSQRPIPGEAPRPALPSRPMPDTPISRPEEPAPIPDTPRPRPVVPAPAPIPDTPRPRPVVPAPAPIPDTPRPRPVVPAPAPIPDTPRLRPVVPAPINSPRPRPVVPAPAPIPDTPRLRPEAPVPAPVPRPDATAPLSISDTQDCGSLNGLQGFIVGGDLAQEGAWPWLVSIAIRGQSGLFSGWCTGSMITRRHVVSAAHCFENRDPSLYVARIGHVNQSQAQEYSIRRIAVPETYARGRFYDDIAILTLTNAVNAENFSPICLPPTRNFVDLTGQGTAVAGWGSTEPGGPLSESLRQLTALPVISNSRCDTELTARVTGFRRQFNRGISEGLICAAFLEGGRDTCAGDSGGPMMYLNEDDRWYLVGVVSFGISCAEPGFPAGYTRVTEYLDWIRNNIRD